MGAIPCADGCNPLRFGVQPVAPEQYMNTSKEEITQKRADVPTHTHEAPSQPGQLSLTPELQPRPAEKSSPAPTPKPKRATKRATKRDPKPELDPAVWNRFAALAVEAGQVAKLPEPGAKSYQQGKTRADVLATLVAEHGAERVLAVWQHTLTSPRRDPTWWRTNREGPALIGAFLAGEAYQRLADDLDAAQQAEHRQPRPRLALVTPPIESTDPAEALRVLSLTLGDEDATKARVEALVPDEAVRRDVVALAHYLAAGGSVLTGFAHGKSYTTAQLQAFLPDARRRWQAVLDAKAAAQAAPELRRAAR